MGAGGLEFLCKFKDSLNDNGDFKCFEEHLAPHASLIYMSAYRLCGNQHDAEDYVQETFYYALKHFSQVRDRSKTKYWLFSILRNLFLKDVEKKKHRLEIEFDSFCSSLSDNKHPEHDYLEEELKALIQDVLGKLDARLRQPLKLFYFDGRSYKEISESLDIPIGTVMSRIARGKVYMKRELVRNESIRIGREKMFIDAR